MNAAEPVKRPRPRRSKNADRFRQVVRDIAEMAPHAAGEELTTLEEDERETPPNVFDPLNTEFRFDIDVAASLLNHKCMRFCTPLGTYLGGVKLHNEDGLTVTWDQRRVWCNPPFSNLALWLEKAWDERAESTVILLPNNRCEQPFWQRLVEPYRDRAGSLLTTRQLPKRRAFLRRVNGELVVGKSPPFGLVICLWDRRNPLQKAAEEAL